MKWINVNFFDELEAVKTFLLLNVLIPFKRFLLSLPWIGVVGCWRWPAFSSAAGGSPSWWRLARPSSPSPATGKRR